MVDEEDQADGVSNSVGQAQGAPGGVTGVEADEAGRNKGKEKEAEEVQQEEEEEEEEVLEEPDEETLGKMSSMEQRLFKIRLKMNKVPFCRLVCRLVVPTASDVGFVASCCCRRCCCAGLRAVVVARGSDQAQHTTNLRWLHILDG